MQPERIIAPDGTWEKWILDDKYHREDGPAIIRYEDGVVVYEEWWVNGIPHRTDDSACIKYEGGKAVYKQWWVNGIQLTKADFTSIDMIDRMKAYSLFSPIEIAKMRKNEA